MKISASFLGIKENLKENIELLTNLDIDYLHLDVMDGDFVNNKTLPFEEIKQIISYNKPLDIHLMVSDAVKYIETYKLLNPKYITIHYELNNDPNFNLSNVIKKIKNYGIKVGISIKPQTSVDKLLPFLNEIDLVLVMSVEPGQGGQKFLPSSIWKIAQLAELKENKDYNYQISVDGGINEKTINQIKEADIAVIGSAITNGNYQKNIENIIDIINE